MPIENIVNWSRRVRSLVLLVAALCLACWLLIGVLLATDEEHLIGRRLVGWLVPALWIPWLLLQWSHYRLVRFGGVGARYLQAPSFVNRPDFITRLAMHLTVNWMVLATTLGLASVLTGTREGRSLSGLIVVASVVSWSWFNWQHRRGNRSKNLALSTTLAMALIAASIGVFRS